MPLPDVLPLPAYKWDSNISEDENYLTWTVILARNSFSKKGHMAALVVRSSLSDSDSADRFQTQSQSQSQVVVHANNYPIGFNTSAKQVSEIHAEAYCISLSSRYGYQLEGCTMYVTFPPCNECLKLIIASGIKRCVFRKILPRSVNEAYIVAASVNQVELRGSSFVYDILDSSSRHQEFLLQELNLSNLISNEQDSEIQREKSAKSHWITNGETTQMTRTRVDEFWKNWQNSHRAVAKEIKDKWKAWEVVEEKYKRALGKGWMNVLSTRFRQEIERLKRMTSLTNVHSENQVDLDSEQRASKSLKTQHNQHATIDQTD